MFRVYSIAPGHGAIYKRCVPVAIIYTKVTVPDEVQADSRPPGSLEPGMAMIRVVPARINWPGGAGGLNPKQYSGFYGSTASWIAVVSSKPSAHRNFTNSRVPVVKRKAI